MSQASQSMRRTTLFSGHVQGVGFRYTVRSVARGFAVSGYVRNLPDGRVELVAEGLPTELDRFLAAVEEAMAGYIRDRRISEFPGSGEFSGFEVRP